MKFLSVNELKNPLNYNEYKALITDLASKNKCTGEQIEEKIKATAVKTIANDKICFFIVIIFCLVFNMNLIMQR